MISIYVGNLPYDTTEAGLVELFGAHGEVHRASLVTDRETHRPRGFGFVEMPNRDEALKAIEALGGTDYNGRPLTVNEARRNTSRNTANLSRSAKHTDTQEDTPQESHGSAGYASKPDDPSTPPPPVEEEADADDSNDGETYGNADTNTDTDADDTSELGDSGDADPPPSGYSNTMGE